MPGVMCWALGAAVVVFGELTGSTRTAAAQEEPRATARDDAPGQLTPQRAAPVEDRVAQDQPAGPTEEEARALFVAGRVAFDEGRYDEALDRWETAYQRSGRPELLFNVALAAERGGDAERALESYRRYLHALPDAENRRGVEGRIALLEERLDRRTDGETASRSEADGARLWTWVAGGTAVALAVGGSIAWLSARSAYESHKEGCGATPSGCTSEQIDDVTGPLTVSRVLFGVGLVAAAAAAVLFIIEPSWGRDSDLEVGVGPAGIYIGGRM